MELVQAAYERYNRSGFSELTLRAADFVLKSTLPQRIRRQTAEACLNNCINSIVDCEELSGTGKKIIKYPYSSSEDIKIELPQVEGRIPSQLSTHSGEYYIDQPTIYYIDNGKLIGTSALAMVNNNLLIETATVSRSDVLMNCLIENPIDILYMNLRHSKDTSNLKNVVPLVQHWNSYHHWILNSLPMLQGISNFEKQTGIKPKLLIPDAPSSWQKTSLNLLGYDSTRVVEWDSRSADVDGLIIPSLRRYIDPEMNIFTIYDKYDEYSKIKVVSKNGLKWLRSKLTSKISEKLDNDFSSKVVISREDVQRRTISNKQEYRKLLKSRGYDFYKLANMSFKEQVALFSSAECVVGPHGMGFTNLVFADGCKVLEIFGDNYIKSSYYILSELLDHEYQFIIGNQDPTEGRDGDIRVDIDELARSLESMDNKI